ncbi:hypothetical protein HG530_008395 [Fusarium avenaceum]|nr:hypothetical protein HG530_008395 [Fusarium avenaceum]
MEVSDALGVCIKIVTILGLVRKSCQHTIADANALVSQSAKRRNYVDSVLVGTHVNVVALLSSQILLVEGDDIVDDVGKDDDVGNGLDILLEATCGQLRPIGEVRGLSVYLGMLGQQLDANAIDKVIAGDDDHVGDERIKVLPQFWRQLTGIPVEYRIAGWLSCGNVELQLPQHFGLILKDVFGVEKEDCEVGCYIASKGELILGVDQVQVCPKAR